jgi:hypothetical protein
MRCCGIFSRCHLSTYSLLCYFCEGKEKLIAKLWLILYFLHLVKCMKNADIQQKYFDEGREGKGRMSEEGQV